MLADQSTLLMLILADALLTQRHLLLILKHSFVADSEALVLTILEVTLADDLGSRCLLILMHRLTPIQAPMLALSVHLLADSGASACRLRVALADADSGCACAC